MKNVIKKVIFSVVFLLLIGVGLTINTKETEANYYCNMYPWRCGYDIYTKPAWDGKQNVYDYLYGYNNDPYAPRQNQYYGGYQNYWGNWGGYGGYPYVACDFNCYHGPYNSGWQDSYTYYNYQDYYYGGDIFYRW